MKIRKGLVSNSSSSSFICEVSSNPAEVCQSIELIKSELLRDDLDEFTRDTIALRIFRDISVGTFENLEDWEAFKVRDFINDMSDEELLALYNSGKSLKEYDLEKNGNVIKFDATADNDNSEFPLEYYPSLYLKCKFTVESNH